MNPHETHALQIEANGVRTASARLVQARRPTATRTVQLPPIVGNTPQADAVAADEALELTLGAIARANLELASLGIGLARSEPLRTRMSGEFVGFDVSSGRAWFRLDTKGKR